MGVCDDDDVCTKEGLADEAFSCCFESFHF